jgi:hypothetical protein
MRKTKNEPNSNTTKTTGTMKAHDYHEFPEPQKNKTSLEFTREQTKLQQAAMTSLEDKSDRLTRMTPKVYNAFDAPDVKKVKATAPAIQGYHQQPKTMVLSEKDNQNMSRAKVEQLSGPVISYPASTYSRRS